MRQFSVLALAFAFLTAVDVSAKEDKKQVDPSGTWRWQYEWQGETHEDTVRLNLGKDGKVVGTFRGQSEKDIEIKDGKMEGDRLSYSFTSEWEGAELLVNFSGTIKGDEIDGRLIAEVNGGSHEFPWKPKRSVQMDDVVGTWEIRIDANGNVFEPTMTISKDGKEYKTSYVTMQGQELEVKNLRVEKNSLLFTATAEFEGNTLTVDYSGRPYGDKYVGKIEYDIAGNSGEVDFAAKRRPEKKNAEEKKDKE